MFRLCTKSSENTVGFSLSITFWKTILNVPFPYLVSSGDIFFVAFYVLLVGLFAFLVFVYHIRHEEQSKYNFSTHGIITV